MAASTSTAADSTNNIRYDVFISHRGPDVKKTFASHLYRRLKSHGLQVFLDYEELQGGEELTDQIKGAIRTASVHVAIFSPNYAASKWCLDELVFMLESGAPIIPVFHHVEPADLRWTQGEGVYARSLRDLEQKRAYDSEPRYNSKTIEIWRNIFKLKNKKTADNSEPRYNSKTIENWRSALSRAAYISGLDLKACNGDEGELLEKVVDVVFKKGVKIPLNVATYPTGMDEKVADFEKKVLSQQHSGRVQLVGITGFGGVGKTTLAKELFNRKRLNYCKSYFLFDVRESAKKSLHSLQSKLFKGLFQRDMPVDNKDEGIEMLKKLLSSSPVLLVLDDVDEVDQVEALLPVNALHRDSLVLDDVDKVDQVEALLPVNVLHRDSLILITSRDKSILTRSRVQDSSIYKLTGLNTELSRELFCSHAFCQPHPLSGFEDLVNKFLKACDGLPLSLKVFGGLLYGNTDKSCWKDELERLEEILPHQIQKKLQISYDALESDERKMFLDIACFFIGKNKDTVIRIWDGSGWKGALGFQSLLNKCLVEVDINGFNSGYQRTENCIKMHDHLRDLGRVLANAKGSGLPCRIWRGKKDMDDFLQQSNMEEDLLKCLLEGKDSRELLWFRWRNFRGSSLPPCIPMKQLRVLEVDGYNLETLWPEELQAPLQLRELRIRVYLFKIPKSIGQLKRLERMEVAAWTVGGDCEIPKEFCDLRSLKHLTLHISKMRSLPDSFGNLSTLEHIDLSGCSALERLPESFGNLIKLKYLNLRDCSNLTHSSGPFEKISTLEYIDLTGCHKIEVLHFQILHQGSREELYLELRNSEEWSAIRESCPLEKLVLKTPSLETLPPSPGRLRNLKYVELRGCRSLKRLPDSFLLLNQLTEWIVEDCSLQELRFKTFEGESETLSTESKGQMRLNSLDSSFYECLLRLQHLRLYSTKISKISFPTGICPNLQHLQIQNCNDLLEVGTLPTALINLQIHNCNDLLEVGTLPTALINLEVFDCPRLRKIEGFCGLSELQKLRIGQHGEGLQSIEPLVFEGMTLNNIQLSAQATQLRNLYVYECSELEELPGLEHLRLLEKLWAYQCVKLKSIRFSAQMTELRELKVSRSSELEELPGLEHLMSLVELSAYECVKLKSIRFSAQMTGLRELNVSRCSELEELPGLEYLRSLEKLSAYECVKLKSIRFSAQVTQLRNLYVYGCSELEELPGLEHLRSLEKLWAYECVKLKSIRFSAQVTQLRNLYVYGCSELEQLPGLEHLRSLENLWADECVKLKSIRFSAQVTELRELKVSRCSELEELPGLEHLRSLEELWACDCVKLKSIRFSAQVIQLRNIYVNGCSELEELPGLEHLRSLEKFSAYECVKLKTLRFACWGQLDLSPHPTRIRELNVSGCSELEELPGLEYLWSLENLWVDECVKLKSIRFSAQVTQLPNLYVYGFSELEEVPGLEYLRSYSS